LPPAGFSHSFDAGANASAGFGNLLVGRTRDSLFKINQAGVDEGGMRVGIDKPRQHDLTLTIDLKDSLAVVFQPRVAKSIFGFSDRNDFAAEAENSGIFNDVEFVKRCSATRARVLRAQCQQLANVNEKQIAASISGLGWRQGEI
jgi:hypothetical protein